MGLFCEEIVILFFSWAISTTLPFPEPFSLFSFFLLSFSPTTTNQPSPTTQTAKMVKKRKNKYVERIHPLFLPRPVSFLLNDAMAARMRIYKDG